MAAPSSQTLATDPGPQLDTQPRLPGTSVSSWPTCQHQPPPPGRLPRRGWRTKGRWRHKVNHLKVDGSYSQEIEPMTRQGNDPQERGEQALRDDVRPPRPVPLSWAARTP